MGREWKGGSTRLIRRSAFRVYNSQSVATNTHAHTVLHSQIHSPDTHHTLSRHTPSCTPVRRGFARPVRARVITAAVGATTDLPIRSLESRVGNAAHGKVEPPRHFRVPQRVVRTVPLPLRRHRHAVHPASACELDGVQLEVERVAQLRDIENMVFKLCKYGIVVLARNSLSIGIILEDWLVKIWSKSTFSWKKWWLRHFFACRRLGGDDSTFYLPPKRMYSQGGLVLAPEGA